MNLQQTKRRSTHFSNSAKFVLLVCLLAGSSESIRAEPEEHCALPRKGNPLIYQDQQGKNRIRFNDGRDAELIQPVIYENIGNYRIPTIKIPFDVIQSNSKSITIQVQVCKPEVYSQRRPVPTDMEGSQIGIPDIYFKSDKL